MCKIKLIYLRNFSYICKKLCSLRAYCKRLIFIKECV